MMLQVLPLQLAWNSPLSILCIMVEVLDCGSPQSSATVPSKFIVFPWVKFLVSFGIGLVFVSVPISVKFSGVVMLLLT